MKIALTIALAAATIVTATPALARNDAAGYKAWQDGRTGAYCVQPRTMREATRFDMPVGRVECHSKADWSRLGATVASVDDRAALSEFASRQ